MVVVAGPVPGVPVKEALGGAKDNGPSFDAQPVAPSPASQVMPSNPILKANIRSLLMCSNAYLRFPAANAPALCHSASWVVTGGKQLGPQGDQILVFPALRRNPYTYVFFRVNLRNTVP